MNALELIDLKKYYGPVKAVDGITLRLAKGKRLALLGVNGAGKTTTIHMITGLIQPSGGSVKLLGHPAGSPAAKALVGLSPQQTAVAPNLTVRENLLFMANIFGMKGGQNRAEEMLKALGLQEVANRRAKKLSGGYERRLSIAMALMNEPKLLVLDEPTLGLDVLARRELWKLIEGLDTTLLLTTHYMEEAARLADTVAVMHRGKLLAADTRENLIKQTGTATLEEAFVALTEGREVR